MHYLVSVLVYNNIAGEEKAGCFTLIEFYRHLTVSVLYLFLTMLWVGLQCVIVAFPGHIH